MKKKYDSDITGWITVNGRRVPLRESKKKMSKSDETLAKALTKKLQDLNTQSAYQYNMVRESIARLNSDKYDDGTYDASTLAPKDYQTGFQVTYCQIGDNYSDDEHNALIREFLAFTDDGIVSLGKFGGTPEHSFHIASKEEAIRLAKKYNQISIWDWENMDEIKTGGTGEKK